MYSFWPYDSKQTFRYVFPVNRVRKGSRILIYDFYQTAGDYIKFITKNEYCNLVAVISDDNSYFYSFYSERIYPVSEVAKFEFDYILISNFEDNYAEVVYELSKYDIPRSKIISSKILERIEGKNYIKDILNYYFKVGDYRKIEKNFCTKEIIKAFEQYDNADIFSIAETVIELKRILGRYTDSLFEGFDEGTFYGNRKTIEKYSGVDVTTSIMPKHGVNTMPRYYDTHYNLLTPFVLTQSAYDIYGTDFIYQISVGPFIAYTEQPEADVYAEAKGKCGRTLVIFPYHGGMDLSLKNTAKDYLNDIAVVVKRYRELYDTIIVSLNYNDLDEERIKEINRTGAIVVCAGVILDQKFLNNLRFIIELADDVLVFDIWGTPLWYSVLLKKEVIYYSNKYISPLDNANVVNKYDKYRKQMFSEIKSGEYLNYKLRKLISETFDFNKVRSKKEMRALIEINAYIIKSCEGNQFEYFSSLHRYYVGLTDKKDNDSKIKRKLLEEIIFPSGKGYILWGAGQYGKAIIKILRQRNQLHLVDGIADSNYENDSFEGVRTYSKEAAFRHGNIVICTSDMFYQDIKKMLIEEGKIKSNTILSYEVLNIKKIEIDYVNCFNQGE